MKKSPRHLPDAASAWQLTMHINAERPIYTLEGYTTIYTDMEECWTGFMIESMSRYSEAQITENLVVYASKVHKGRGAYITRNTVCGEFELSKSDKLQLEKVVLHARRAGLSIKGFLIFNDEKYRLHTIADIMNEPPPGITWQLNYKRHIEA